jgi:hypothetical protein
MEMRQKSTVGTGSEFQCKRRGFFIGDNQVVIFDCPDIKLNNVPHISVGGCPGKLTCIDGRQKVSIPESIRWF